LARYGLVGKAIERLRSILRADPAQHEAHRALVSIYLDHSRLDRAADAATQMAGSSPGALSSAAWQAVRAQLVALGFQIDGRTVLPPVEASPKPSEARGGHGVDALLRGLVLDKGKRAERKAPAAPADTISPRPIVTGKLAKAPPPPAPPRAKAPPPLPPPLPPPPPAVEVGKPPAAPVSPAAGLLGLEQLEDESAARPTGEVKPASDWLDLGDLSAPWTEIPQIRGSLPKPAPPSAAAAAGAPALGSTAENLFEDTAVSWLNEPTSGRSKASEELFSGEGDFFDLAAELERELSEERSPQAVAPEVAEQSLEDIVATFKKGVSEVLSAEDYDTHFNLGIAYREMGLTDEAIGEFQLAARAPQHLLDCCSLLGMCFLEKGIPELAVKWYRRGLDTLGLTEEQGLALRYELGNALATAGERAEAYKAFVEIYGNNSNYRDVVARVAELRPR
jgi:tetratricopeptide (TPR) repeat protein